MIISPTIRGSGEITGAYQSADGDILAVASRFPRLVNPPGRATYSGQRLRYRLALHRRGELQPFAVLDELHLPINDVSFHPTESVLAVAAGSYDGGFAFAGELLFWNWHADHCWPAAGYVPEVERCSFTADGERLDALVRPWDEEWGVGDDPFDRVYPLSVPYGHPEVAAGSKAEIDPGAAIVRHTLEFARPDLCRQGAVDRQLMEWFGVDRISRRGAIWDMIWLDSARLAIVHDDCLVEIHDVVCGGVTSIKKDGYYGATLLHTSPPIVASYELEGWQKRHSRLSTIANDTLVDIATLEGSYNFVSCRSGRILGRLDRSQAGKAGRDVLVEACTGDITFDDLGHYDCFNHYLGIDGGPDLFILQGTPESQHEKKRLCLVRKDGSLETLWHILPADGSPTSHAMECLGCYIDDGLGPSVIIAGLHYDPAPRNDVRGFVFRRPIQPNKTTRFGFFARPKSSDVPQDTWRLATGATASAMIHSPKEKLVIIAFLDGTLSLLKAKDGEIVASGKVLIDGFPTVVYSMDLLNSTLALGTFDGRIAVLQLDKLRECGKGAPIELK